MNHAYQSHIDPMLNGRSNAMLSKDQWASIAHALNITPRELQVIQGVFDGDTESLIAEKLCISAHTIHTHLDRIYRKLNATCRCDLVVSIFAEYIAQNSSTATNT